MSLTFQNNLRECDTFFILPALLLECGRDHGDPPEVSRNRIVIAWLFLNVSFGWLSGGAK
jgi:hypothetical protein